MSCNAVSLKTTPWPKNRSQHLEICDHEDDFCSRIRKHSLLNEDEQPPSESLIGQSLKAMFSDENNKTLSVAMSSENNANIKKLLIGTLLWNWTTVTAVRCHAVRNTIFLSMGKQSMRNDLRICLFLNVGKSSVGKMMRETPLPSELKSIVVLKQDYLELKGLIRN